MTPTEAKLNYSLFVNTLVKPGQAILESLDPSKVDLWHAATGVAGEAGELLDAVKKAAVYNKPLDRVNVIEELGDLEFYMEQVRQNLSITRDETLTANVDKLFKRYENAVYTDKQAHDRNDKVEAVWPVETAAPVEPPQHPTFIKPTIGRVVWYYQNNFQVTPWPALISHVNAGGTINVGGFDRYGINFARQEVTLLQEGDAIPALGQFVTWMPYQVQSQLKANKSES